MKKTLQFLRVLSIAITLLAMVRPMPTRADSPNEPQPAIRIYLPVAFGSGNDPIYDYTRAVDLNRFTQQMAYITEEFGPRHQDYMANYIDDACTPDPQPNPDNKNNLIRSLEYVTNFLASLGYEIKLEAVEDPWGYNVIAKRRGSVYAEKIFEIGAHIDNHKRTPGASDNSSGVAAVLEIATVLKDYPNRFTWRFIIFVGEEYGRYGSITHTQKAAAKGEKIKMALIMDGIGWSEIAPQHMNCIFTHPSMPKTLETAYLFDQARGRYDIDIGWRLCGDLSGQVSDNNSYWEQGFNAVLSVGGLPYTAPTYHRCNDTMSNADVINAYKTTQENLAVLLMLDSTP